jgi:protein TonB
VLLVAVHPRDVVKPVVVFPISLVSMPGGGGIPGAAPGEPAPGPPAAAVEPALPAPPPIVEAPKPVEPPKAIAKPAPERVVKKKVVAKPKPTPTPEAPPSSEVASIPPRGADSGAAGGAGDASGATGTRGGGGGNGSGGGGGGGGTSASPAYGSNPQPPYPMAARRLGIEGTVVLRVVVAPDGTPKSVVVLESSGHDVLDASALETVRTRWRFVPARRNGIPIEDSVQVPIRFHQTG